MYLSDTGLSDLGVFESNFGVPEVSVGLAHEPEDVPKLKELLLQAQRAARGQRAEFARRGGGTSSPTETSGDGRSNALTKPAGKPSCKEQQKHFLGTAVVCLPAWQGTRSWKGTAAQWKRLSHSLPWQGHFRQSEQQRRPIRSSL